MPWGSAPAPGTELPGTGAEHNPGGLTGIRDVRSRRSTRSLTWRGSTVTRRGEVSRVIEVLCESVSDDYLAYLQKKGAAYLFAGQSRLDLPLLLEKLEGAASFVRQHLSDFSVQSRIVSVLVQIMINRFGPD